jgi:hypothetical protein
MATQKVVVAGSSVSASQLKDLFRQIEDGSINGKRLQLILDHQNPWDKLSNLNWGAVYEKLGLAKEFEAFRSNVVEREGLWAVPVLQGVTCNQVVAAMKALDVQFYLCVDDLDKAVVANNRDPQNGSYVVHFCRTVEADPELANRSTKDLAADGTKGITLLERLLLELACFLATGGEHLDVENITLCSGSRNSGGGVPSVDWCAGGRKVCVSIWCDPDCRRVNLRTRSVVPLYLTP